MRSFNMSTSLFSVLLILLPLAVTVSAAAFDYARDPAECAKVLGGTNVTVIFTADPGAQYNGTGEGSYIAAAIKNPRSVLIPGCFNATVGWLSGGNVAQIVTGEGPSTAQMCTFAVLACSSIIKEAIYFGTAGFSPRRGGVLNPTGSDACKAPASTSQDFIVRPGDLCVTNHAVNWDCQSAAWSQTAAAFPNECSSPGNPDQPFANMYSDPQDASYRGWDCVINFNASKASRDLADALVAGGSSSVAKIVPTEPISTFASWYWGNTSLSMGVPFTPNVTAPPTIYKRDACAEIDTVYWWLGLPWDVQARGMAAYAVKNRHTDVVAASAMEGVGFLAGLRNAQALTGIAIPYAIVRSASDYVHNPVKPSAVNASIWLNGPSVAKPSGLADGDAFATIYAIQTGSTLILGALNQRCLAAGNTQAFCDGGKPNAGVRESAVGSGMLKLAAIGGVALNLI